MHGIVHLPDEVLNAGEAAGADEVPARHPAEEHGQTQGYPPLPAAMACAAAYAVEKAAWRL